MALGSSDHMTLGDRYELSDVIDQGGMAVVWVAFDRQLQRQVAVKVLPADPDDPVSQRRFYREARHVASLSHRNVVQIFDFGMERQRSFIVMEYVRGVSMRKVLSVTSPLPVAETCRVAVDTLAALAHAHERGIIHRDVKPANLLVDENGVVKVTDFGIARASNEASELTAGGTFIGTVGYASPEQLSGGSVGPASDLYSLGCVLYQCLTGKTPFDDDDPGRLATQHQFAEPPWLADIRSDVPRGVAHAISTSLAKSPEERFSTAREMAESLAPYAAGDLAERVYEVETAPRVVPPAHHDARSSCRRRMVLSAAIALVAIVATTLLWVFAGSPGQSTASQLISGGLLAPGQSLSSPDGHDILIMQHDGNLVAYRAHPKVAIWQSGTSGFLRSYLVMQSDGNLVIYPFGKSAPLVGHPSPALWCSGTSGHPGSSASFLNGGDLVVRDANARVLFKAPHDPTACTPTT